MPGTQTGILFNRFCGLERSCSWDSPPAEIPAPAWSSLSELYAHPSDVDVLVGGLLERPAAADAALGKTLGCIVAKQYRALRDGDRWEEALR